MSEEVENKELQQIPVLPLRDTVVFPKMIVPLFVGRTKSINALQKVNDENGTIVLATQKKADMEDPKEDDIYHIGTLGNILQMLKLPDGTVKVLIEGVERIEIKKIYDNGEYISAAVVSLPDTTVDDLELEALSRAVISQFED